MTLIWHFYQNLPLFQFDLHFSMFSKDYFRLESIDIFFYGHIFQMFFESFFFFQPVEKRRMIRKTFGRYDHKKICQYSPNGSNLLKTWKSANQIETEEGFDKNAILRSCKRIQIRAYHDLWRFEGDTDMEPKLAEFAYEDD